MRAGLGRNLVVLIKTRIIKNIKSRARVEYKKILTWLAGSSGLAGGCREREDPGARLLGARGVLVGGGIGERLFAGLMSVKRVGTWVEDCSRLR